MVQFYHSYEPRFGFWSPMLRQLDDVLDVMTLASSTKLATPLQNLHFEQYETDELYIMNIDVPGVSREDMQIELEGRQIHIAGQRKHEGKNGPRVTSFSQRIHIPEGVQPEHISADLKDGVLRLAVQKPAAHRPTKIKIGDGAPQGFLKSWLGSDKKSSDTIEVKKSNRDTVALSG